MLKRAAIAASGLLLVGQQASAQSTPFRLGILTEVVSRDGMACGIDEQLEGEALRAAMRANRVGEAKPNASANPPFVYANVNTLITGANCVSNVRLEIKKYAFDVDNGLRLGTVDVVFCSKESLVAGPNHAARVSAAIRALFDDCIVQMQGGASNPS